MHHHLKEKIYLLFQQIINERITRLQNVLADLKESAANETKSTAGDKHETALAMLQTEQKNIKGQLEDAQIQKSELNKINPLLSPDKIVKGSLVETNRGYFFVSAALGKVVTEGITVTSLSPLSPLGENIMGLHAGKTATINGNIFEIKSVC